MCRHCVKAILLFGRYVEDVTRRRARKDRPLSPELSNGEKDVPRCHQQKAQRCRQPRTAAQKNTRRWRSNAQQRQRVSDHSRPSRASCRDMYVASHRPEKALVSHQASLRKKENLLTKSAPERVSRRCWIRRSVGQSISLYAIRRSTTTNAVHVPVPR